MASPIVSTITGYVEEHRTELISKAVLVGRTANYLNLMTGVVGPSTLNLFDTTVVLQDGSTCGFTDSGTTTLSQRILTPKIEKCNMSYCPKNLLQTYAQHLVKVGAGKETLPFEEKWVSSIADGVSEAIEKEYIFSNIIRNKIKCIYNPVSTSKILKQIKKLKKIGEKEYDICCVGRLTEQKNPFMFVEIVKEMKKYNNDIKAIWIGDGELKNELSKKIVEMGLDTNIELVGFKKNPYEYMNNSKVFVLPSKWEGYGLVAFEALSMGIPCVVSNVGGLKEIVSSKCGLLCSDLNHFVCEINLLLNDITYYRKKSTEAILQSEKLDNSVDYYKTLKKIYDDYK